MPKPDDFTFTIGLVGGETIQFADGRSPGKIGAGIALSEEAFDLVEPHLRAVVPKWTAGYRFGTFELNARARTSLAKSLQSEANVLSGANSKVTLFRVLANWLEERTDKKGPVSIFGI